jgi:hypothetical protein
MSLLPVSGGDTESIMKIFAAMTFSALLATSSLVLAQGVSDKTPGHKMQDKGSVKGEPGASGYAPGHRMQDKGSVKGTTGASGYAPGQTTGAGIKDDHKKK